MGNRRLIYGLQVLDPLSVWVASEERKIKWKVAACCFGAFLLHIVLPSCFTVSTEGLKIIGLGSSC